MLRSLAQDPSGCRILHSSASRLWASRLRASNLSMLWSRVPEPSACHALHWSASSLWASSLWASSLSMLCSLAPEPSAARSSSQSPVLPSVLGPGLAASRPPSIGSRAMWPVASAPALLREAGSQPPAALSSGSGSCHSASCLCACRRGSCSESSCLPAPCLSVAHLARLFAFRTSVFRSSATCPTASRSALSAVATRSNPRLLAPFSSPSSLSAGLRCSPPSMEPNLSSSSSSVLEFSLAKLLCQPYNPCPTLLCLLRAILQSTSDPFRGALVVRPHEVPERKNVLPRTASFSVGSASLAKVTVSSSAVAFVTEFARLTRSLGMSVSMRHASASTASWSLASLAFLNSLATTLLHRSESLAAKASFS
mmetsp:Transcript_29195/g.93122  ORF Transcript_29195/g.93122 Transcript_29195/m.93122 type:complete len:368 (-) Transcript_29195:471-1574(-)